MSEKDDQAMEISNTETTSENNLPASMDANTVSEVSCIEADKTLNTPVHSQLANRVVSVLDANETEIDKSVKSDGADTTNVLPEVTEEIDIKEQELDVGITTNTDGHATAQSHILQADNMEIEESVKCDTDAKVVQIENIACQVDSDKDDATKTNIVSTFELDFPPFNDDAKKNDLDEKELLGSAECTPTVELSECEDSLFIDDENKTQEMPNLENIQNITKEDVTLEYKSEFSIINQTSEIISADDKTTGLDVEEEIEKVESNLEKEFDEPKLEKDAGGQSEIESEEPKMEEESGSNLDEDLKNPICPQESDYSDETPQREGVTENLKESYDFGVTDFSRRSSSSSDAESDIILGELEAGYATGRHSQSPFQCMDEDDEIDPTPSAAAAVRWQSQNLETNIETRAKEAGIRQPDKDDLDLSLVDSEAGWMEHGSGSDTDIAQPRSKLHVNETQLRVDGNTVKSDSLMEQPYQTPNIQEDEETPQSDGDTDSDTSTDSTLPCDERVDDYPGSSQEMDIIYQDNEDNKDEMDIKVESTNNLGPNQTDQEFKLEETACQEMDSDSQNIPVSEADISTRVTEYSHDDEEQKPKTELYQISMETDSDVINSEESFDERVKTSHDHHDRKRHEILEEYDNVGEDEGVSGPRAKKPKGQMYESETAYRQGVDEIYSDDQVVDAMKKLTQGVDEDKQVRPASYDDEEVPPSTRRHYDWNTHHFFPDIHDVNRFGVVWRRRGDTEGSQQHQYVEEEWVRDLHYFEQLKLQQSLNQTASHKGAKMPGRTEMGGRANCENYPPVEDSSRREMRSPRYVEKNIYVDSRLDIDSDSSSGLEESDEAPKIWYKSPLHMRRTKRREQRQTTVENKHLAISENERRARAKAYWGSPRLRRREDGTKIRRVPRRSSAPDPTNGSGRQARVIAPRYNSDLMHEKLLKFEEMKRRRRALDDITDENAKSPPKATPMYRAHIATNFAKSVEIPDEHRQQREYVCYIPVNPLRVSRSQEDVRYEERIPLAEVSDGRGNVDRGKQAPYYYGRHKDPKQHRRQQVVPTQVKSQYDFLSLEVMNKGGPVPLEDMYSSSPSLRRPAERFREFSSSFENIYDAVDLSMYDTPLDGRDMLEYERRQNMSKRPDRKTENQYRDFSSEEKKQQYKRTENSKVTNEAFHPGHPDGRVSHDTLVPHSDPGHTSSDFRKWYGQNAQTERDWRCEEPAKKKKFDAKSLVEEEQKKFQEYKREYVRRHSDLDSTSGEDRRYILDGTRQHSELESTSGDERHSHIPPDDYEYILRKVHHQRQDAMYGESSADMASDHSSISSPREGNLSKEIDSESDGKKGEFRKCEHIRGNQSEICQNLKSKGQTESGHVDSREFKPSLPDDINSFKNGHQRNAANKLGKLRIDQDPDHYQRVQLSMYRDDESSIRDNQKRPAEDTAGVDKQRARYTEHIERRLPATDEASDQNNVFLVHSKPPVHRFQDNPKVPLSWQYNTVYQPDSPSQDSSAPHETFKSALEKWQQRDVEKCPLGQSDELRPAEDKGESGDHRGDPNKSSDKAEQHDQLKQSGHSDHSREQPKYSQSENQAPRLPDDDRTKAEPRYRERADPRSDSEPRYRERADPRSNSEPRYRERADPRSDSEPKYRERADPRSDSEPRYRSGVPPLNWPGYKAEERDDIYFPQKHQQTERIPPKQSDYHYGNRTEGKYSYPFDYGTNVGYPSPKQQEGTNWREDGFYGESHHDKQDQRVTGVRSPNNKYKMWWSDYGRYGQGSQTEMRYREWTEPASQAEPRYREHADPRSNSEPRYREPMDPGSQSEPRYPERSQPGSQSQPRYRERSEPSSQPEPRYRERSDAGYQRQAQYGNQSPQDRSRYREPLQRSVPRQPHHSEQRSQLGPMYVDPYEDVSRKRYAENVSYSQSPRGQDSRDSAMQYSNRRPHKTQSLEQIPREKDRRDVSMRYSNKSLPKAAQSVERMPRGQERRDPSIQYSNKSPYKIPESLSPGAREPDKRDASMPSSDRRSPQRSPQSRSKQADDEAQTKPLERSTAPKQRIDMPPDVNRYPADSRYDDRYQRNPYKPQYYAQRPRKELDFDDQHKYRSSRQAVHNGFPEQKRSGNDDKTPQQHKKLPNIVAGQDKNQSSEYSQPDQLRSKDYTRNKPKSTHSNDRIPDHSYVRRPIETGYHGQPLYDERSKYPRYYEPRKPQRTRKEGYTGLYEQSPNWNTGYDPWNEQSHLLKNTNDNAVVSKPVQSSSVSRKSEPTKPRTQQSGFIPPDKLARQGQSQPDLQTPKPPPRTDDQYSPRRSAGQQPYNDRTKQDTRIPDDYHTYKSYEDKVRGYVMKQKQSQASNQYESHVRRGREQYRSQFQTDVDSAVVSKDPTTVDGDYHPDHYIDKNVRKPRATRRIEARLRDTRRARSLPREAHRREYEIEVSKSRGNRLSDTSRPGEHAPSKRAPVYSVQVQKSLEKPQSKYQSPIISVRLTRSTEDLRQKDDPEPRLSVTQLKTKLFGEDGRKLNSRCFQPELAQVWDRRDRKINSIKADLFTNETEFHPPYPPQAILSTYHKDDGDDVRLRDYVSYRDGRVKKRSTINDELTDLEKTYENLDLDNEDFLHGFERVMIPNADYSAERTDPTYNEPNVKRLSITNVKKLEDLQQQVPNPSLEYAKKWLSGERVPGRTVDDGYYVDKQELSPASFEVAQYSKTREQDTPSTVSQSTDKVSGVYGSLPRKRADDMAYRRQKKIVGSSSKTSVTSSHHPTQSYMSLSPGVTPSQSVESLSRRSMSWHARSPDPVYDDAAYRRNLQRSKSPGASDVSDQTLLAQPSPTSTDYLKPRETSPSRGRMRIRPERVADKYHDDLAYRQLRKDVEPVVAKLPETYCRRQRELTSLRTRSQSLERTAGERGSSSRHIQIQRSNSFGPSSKRLVSKERKESLSKGVAKIIDLLSDPIRRTVSEPDLTEPSVFGSYYDARGDFISDDSRYSQYAIKPKKQQTPRTVKLRHELKSKMRLMKTSTDSGYIESESDSPSSSGTDGLSIGRSPPSCSIDSDENTHKQKVPVHVVREEDPRMSKVSTFHIPVQPTFTKTSTSKFPIRAQPPSIVESRSYHPTTSQPCRTESSARTVPQSYQRPVTSTSASGYNVLVPGSSDAMPAPSSKANAEYTNRGKRTNEAPGNFSEFSICLISTGKPSSEEMKPVRAPVSYAGDIKPEAHEYDYQRRTNYEQQRYSRTQTSRKYVPRAVDYQEKEVPSYQSQKLNLDSHDSQSREKVHVPMTSVSAESNAKSDPKRLNEPGSEEFHDLKSTTVPCSENVETQPYRPTFRWPGKGVKGEKDDKPTSPRTKETSQQIHIPVKTTMEDLPRAPRDVRIDDQVSNDSNLYRDIRVSQTSVQAKPQPKFVSRENQSQDISKQIPSNVTTGRTVQEQYHQRDVPPRTVQDQTQINLSRVENVYTKNWQPERRPLQEEEIKSKGSEGSKTVMQARVERSSADVKPFNKTDENSRSFLEKMNERKREREVENTISDINVAVSSEKTPVVGFSGSTTKDMTPATTAQSETPSQNKPSTSNIASTGQKAPRGRVLVPLPDLIRMQEPRKKIVTETNEKSVKEYAKHGSTAPKVDNSQRVIYMSEGQEKETEIAPNRTRTVEHKFSRKVLEQKTVIVQPLKSDSLHPGQMLRGPGGLSPSHPQFLSHPDRFDLSDGEMTDATDITLDTLVRDNQNRPSSPETLDFSCSELDNDISDVEYISCKSERSVKEYSLPQRDDPNITFTERTQRVTQEQTTSMKNAPTGAIESETGVVMRRKKPADRDKEAEAERRLSIKELVQSFEQKSSPFMRAMAGTELKRCSSQEDVPSQEDSAQKRERVINIRDMSGSDSNLYDPKNEFHQRTSQSDAGPVPQSDSSSWRRC